MRSSPQPHDLCLLSPAINVYSAMRYVPEIPDNWDNAMMYNLPLDEFMQVIDHAINIY